MISAVHFRLLALSLSLLMASIGLSGCSSFLTEPAPARIFTLGTASEMGSSDVQRVNASGPSLTVQVATVAPALSSEQVWARAGQRLQPIRNVRWAERVPELLEKRLTAYLESSGQFSYVTHQRGGARTDLILVADLRALYVELENDEPKRVSVALSARLVERLTAPPLATIVLKTEEPLNNQENDQLAGAFNRGVDRLLAELKAQLVPAAQDCCDPQDKGIN